MVQTIVIAWLLSAKEKKSTYALPRTLIIKLDHFKATNKNVSLMKRSVLERFVSMSTPKGSAEGSMGALMGY